MTLSDHKVYNCIKQAIAERGTMYAAISIVSIAKKTELGHATVCRSLKRLLKAEQIYWEKPRWSKDHNRRLTARYRLLPPLLGGLDEVE